MNNREKILAAVAGLAAVAFVTYMAISRVFLLPAAQRYQQAEELLGRLKKANDEKDKEPAYRARLKELAGNTFSGDEYRVSQQVQSRITAVLAQSGLSAQSLTLKPVVGARSPGVYKEIGWMVRVRGGLKETINFLYLMTREPHLHRLDNLVLTPAKDGTDVELQVKYATLIIEPGAGEKLEAGALADAAAFPAVDAPERRPYELIAMRDLFRPYVAAPPAKPDAPAAPPAAPGAPPPRVPTGRYRLVGLPTWGGNADVLVLDSASGSVAAYKVGDEVAGGTIVMVDYRSLPLPDNPEILSGSRVVLRVGDEYHAVELGNSLAQKYVLAEDRLPPGLPSIPKPPPAPAEPAPEQAPPDAPGAAGTPP